tara:strand:- start:180 stop:395 length:216 start_codon:yes stop_codon:yes gene_type:complete
MFLNSKLAKAISSISPIVFLLGALFSFVYAYTLNKELKNLERQIETLNAKKTRSIEEKADKLIEDLEGIGK